MAGVAGSNVCVNRAVYESWTRERDVVQNGMATIRSSYGFEKGDQEDVCGSGFRACASGVEARVELGWKRVHGGPNQFTFVQRRARRSSQAHGTLQRFLNLRGQREESVGKELAELSENVLNLKGLISRGYTGIGPDMRERVDRLSDRVAVLRQSAQRHTGASGRIPSQMTTNLRALQREHSSLENIIHLAMNGEPLLKTWKLEVSTTGASNDEPRNFWEESLPKPPVLQSFIRESIFDTTRNLPRYVMTSPAAQDSSPFASFRAEIERRVIEQLAGDDGTVEVISQPEISTIVEPTDEALAEEELGERTVEGVIVNDQGQESLIRQPTAVEEQIILSQAQEVRLRNDITSKRNVRKQSRMADLAETKIQKLEQELNRSIPLELHEQAVRRLRESVAEARCKVEQLTIEAREKEGMLTAIQADLLAEKDQLVEKVKELTEDVATRVSVEDMESAITFAVERMQRELETTQERVVMLSGELDKKERSIGRDRDEWILQKRDLELQLDTVTRKLNHIHKERINEKAQLLEERGKVRLLEEELNSFRQSVKEVELNEDQKKEATPATVRELVIQIMKVAKGSLVSPEDTESIVKEVAELQEDNETPKVVKSHTEDIKSNLGLVSREVAALEGFRLSGEKTIALEKFFAIMAQLIKQETDKMDKRPSDAAGELGKEVGIRMLGQESNTSGGTVGGADDIKKPFISIWYESSWKSAYIHYKADNSGWTEVPGILMQNHVHANGKQMKISTIQASSIEFVLTDGHGSWDCAPWGGNYSVNEKGTYSLASGVICKSG